MKWTWMTCLVALGAGSTWATDADERLTLELKDAPAADVVRAVAAAGHLTVPADADFGGQKLTLKLHNAPVRMVLDAVLSQLAVPYRLDGQVLRVGADAPIPPPPAPALNRVPAAPPAGGGEVAALRARVADLERRLATARLENSAITGTPVTPPANLPARFTNVTDLQKAFQAAFRETDFTSAEVRSVDCTEYPCIVYGTGFGERGDMEKLKQAPSFALYARDSQSTFGWTGNDAKASFFGVALYPSPDSEGGPPGNFALRLRSRVDAMHQTFGGK